MSAGQSSKAPDKTPGLHLATFAHQGLLWDTYLEFDDDPRQPLIFRGRLRFDRAATDEAPESTHTTVIIIEESYEEAVAKARRFDGHQLEALLRSALPDGDA